MADLSQVYEALRRADAAGNEEDARQLAEFIRSQSQPMELPAPIEKSGTAGPMEALKGGAKRLLASSQTAVEAPFIGGEEAAARGIARQEAIKERPGASLDEIQKIYKEQGFFPAAKEAITQLPAGLAEQAPNIGAMLASGRLGAMAGSVFGPVGTAVGGIGGALIPSFLPQAGSNIERQKQEGKEVELGKAYGAAIPQAALDVGAMEFGLGKLFKISPTTLGTEAAEKIAKDSLLKAAATGTLKTAAFEMPTEVAQQMLERSQAGLSLTTPDAIKEYTDVAYAAGLLSPLGGVSGVSERGQARDQVKQNDLATQQTLNRIQFERDRIDQIVAEAQSQEQMNLAAEEAAKNAVEELNSLGNKAPEKSKIAKSIMQMQKDFDKAVEQNDIDAQKKAIADLTNVPTNIISLATRRPVVNDETFAEMKIGPTATIRKNKELHGLDPLQLEDNVKLRNALNALYKTKEEDSPQAVAIKKYLDSIPTPKDLQNERTIAEGSGAGVQISGQPMAGEYAGTVEGTDGIGLGGAADNVRQPNVREEGLPAPLKTPKFKPAMGIQAALKQSGGINTEHLFDLTGERSVNKSGATVGLFTKNGRGLDDAVQVAVDKGYLNADVLNEVDGGVGALSDLLIDEIQGKKAVPLDQQADAELEAYLAREEQKQAIQEETTPTKEQPRSPRSNWREAHDTEPDIFRKEPILRAITEISKSDKELSDILDRVNPYYRFHSNIAWDVSQNPYASKQTKQRAKDLYERIMASEEEKLGYTEQANKDLAEATSVEKDIQYGPKEQLGERNPIFDKVTNGKELFKAVMKIANTRSDKAIINMLEKVPNLDTVKVITENTSTDPELQGASGYFDPNTNTIFVDPRVEDLSHVTLHEIAHAATDTEFDKHVKIVNNVHTPITPLGKKMVKLFEAFMAESLKKQEGFYGQKNVKEFFMESYTDNKLKNFLQNRAGVLGLKPAQGKIATLWSDFVNLIKSMFGIPEYAHSMLDEVLLLSPELMKGPGAITTGKEVSQARIPTQGLTRPDGTPLKYLQDTEEGIVDKFKNVFNGDTNQWREWMDRLGNKIVGGRYSIERKGLDANVPEVTALKEGRIRGDLINLQAYNSMSLAQAGLYLGRLVLRKSGLVSADESSGPDKVKMIDISKNWNELIDRATQDLGSKELAYDMLTAGYYAPRYKQLAEFNKTANADEKINIDEWTESDKRTAEEAQRRYGPELKRLQDMRNVQRKDLLDFMVATGLYTREKADRFLQRAEYVALYRVPEEEMQAFEAKPFVKGAGLLGAGKEYRLVGSARAAADPIDNYIANMSWMMQRAIKNNAAKATADFMSDLEIGKWWDRPMTDIEKKRYEGHHIVVHVDGLPKDFLVVNPTDMAAFSSSPIITGAVWDLMKYPVAGLRHGITMMPQFVWNQAWEDPIRATFTSGNKAGFLNNITKTWKSIASNQFKADRTPSAQALNRYGIIGQRDVLDSKDLINVYKGKDKKLWQKSLFFFERMAQGSDLGAREAIFDNAVKELEAQGYDKETAEDYAAVRAHQYMPYQQVGMSRSLAYLRRMMPFVNPPIQGLARDIAAARGRVGGVSKAQGKKMLAFRLAKYMVFTAMYAAFMSGDDDYEDQGDDQQDNNFFLGGLRIPVPQELRPIKVAAERGTRAWVLNSPKADIESSDIAAASIRKAWEIIAGFAPVPSIIRPAAENYTNFDLFSGLPVVSAGQARKEPGLQYTEKTSELAKLVGASLDYSPIKIDHLLKGYFGYLGQTLGQVTNYMSSDRPAPTPNDIVFVGSMLENQRASGNRSDFYEVYDKVTSVKATANALLQEGDREAYKEFIEKNKGYLTIAPTINALHNRVNNLRDRKKIISQSNKSPEEKRALLDKINENENKMLDNIRSIQRKAVELNN